jgi:hypothetical protein
MTETETGVWNVLSSIESQDVSDTGFLIVIVILIYRRHKPLYLMKQYFTKRNIERCDILYSPVFSLYGLFWFFIKLATDFLIFIDICYILRFRGWLF